MISAVALVGGDLSRARTFEFTGVTTASTTPVQVPVGAGGSYAVTVTGGDAYVVVTPTSTAATAPGATIGPAVNSLRRFNGSQPAVALDLPEGSWLAVRSVTGTIAITFNGPITLGPAR